MAKEMKADVVIMGSGASGLSAALTLARGGATVIVLEKTAGFGGMTNYALGMFAVESRHQKREKCGITVEQAFQHHMRRCFWLADARLVRTFMDKSADTIDWLEDIGVEFGPIDSYAPDGPRVWHPVKGFAGPGLIQPLLKKVQAEKNVQILTETAGAKLLTESGNVVGLVAEDRNGNTIHAKAKAVIIAAGGYQDNKEWMEKYCLNGRYISAFVPTSQTGDGLRMAWEAGAKPEGLGILQAYSLVVGDDMTTELTHAAMQPYLWVNKRGERFCDEGVRWDFPMATNTLCRQPEATAFTVFDEDTKTYLKGKGLDYGEILLPTTPLTGLDNEIDRGVKEGKAFQAASLDELAKKISVPETVLAETVKTYNSYCDKNQDFLFGKNRKYLQPVRTPKFYAIKVNVAALISEGGIQINYKMEAVDKDERAIPGLYAVGCSAGGLVGETYPLDTTGGSLGFAVSSGRLAGESIIEYLGK
jgi:fumarate reductase flavoprotein subunit